MILVLLFLLFLTGMILSLYGFIPLNQSLPEHALNISKPEIAIVLDNKDSLTVTESISDNITGQKKLTSKLADEYSKIKYGEIGYDDLSTIETSNLKTNQYLNNTETLNKNSFYLDFNLLPIEEINSFSLHYDDQIKEIVVSMKEYNTNRNGNSKGGQNGKEINEYFVALNDDYKDKNITGFTLDKELYGDKYYITDDSLVLPEKSIKLDKKLVINNFYENTFKIDKMYKIRILFIFKGEITNNKTDFPVIVKDESGGVKFITNNNIQLVRTKINNRKYDMHNIKIYQKNFINKVDEIKYTDN